jgi:DNA-3-methyladenine glycosylase
MVLPRAFYARDGRTVARDLLGKILCAPGGRGRIVETEAYHGPDDAASHARRGPTPRAKIMFGPAGMAYVYLIYGMYSCLNVTTGDDGYPSAVLLRAVAIEGAEAKVGAGPGKLCRALGVDRGLNGHDLTRGHTLWIEDGPPPKKIRRGPRIGVAYAGVWAEKHLRYWADNDPAVSR